MRLSSLAVLGLALLPGCPSAEPAPSTPMDIAGDYSLTGSQLESSCVGASWDFWTVFDFMTRTPNDVAAMSLEITQDGGAITALQGPTGCSWSGTVGAEGTFTLRGPCDTASMEREIALAGTVTPFGLDFDLDGTMSFEVDANDGEGGGPDGVVDCEVSAVDVTGSGAPAQ